VKKIEISKSSLEQLYIIDNKTRKEVANIYGCSVDTIKDRLLKFNLKKNIKFQNIFIDEVLRYVKEEMTIKNIADKCDCSKNLMKRFLKEHNVTLKKDYYVDDNYFKIWTCDMAYLVGIIMTDGCVRDERRELTVVSMDEELGIFFKNQLKTNYKSSKNKYDCGFYRVYSREIVSDLIKMGIIPRKSRVLSLSKIPKNKMDIYFWDILRGIVDGDGCIQRPNKRSIRFNICSGSKIFLMQIQNILKREIDCPEYRIVKKKEGGTYYLQVNGIYAYRCLDNMYNNDKFAIERKKALAIESVDAFEDKKYCVKCGEEMRFFHYSRKYCLSCRKRY